MQDWVAHDWFIEFVSRVGLLRHYIDLRPSPKIRSLLRFVTALTVYGAPGVVPSPDDRGTSYEQASA